MVTWLKTEGIRILVSFVLMFLLFKIISFFCKRLKKHLVKRKVDIVIAKTICQFINIGLKVLVLIMVLGYLGIETSGIAASISSILLAIGLALQGSLANFAGGVLILLMRIYRIGDYVECNNIEGEVEDINMFYTTLITPDNKVISVPNGVSANTFLINYTKKQKRRLDLVFTIASNSDYLLAKKVLTTMIENNEKILEKPFIYVDSVQEGKTNIMTKTWVKTSDYWELRFLFPEQAKVLFDKEGIITPFTNFAVLIKKEE